MTWSVTCPGITSLGTEFMPNVRGSLDFTHQPCNTASAITLKLTHLSTSTDGPHVQTSPLQPVLTLTRREGSRRVTVSLVWSQPISIQDHPNLHFKLGVSVRLWVRSFGSYILKHNIHLSLNIYIILKSNVHKLLGFPNYHEMYPDAWHHFMTVIGTETENRTQKERWEIFWQKWHEIQIAV